MTLAFWQVELAGLHINSEPHAAELVGISSHGRSNRMARLRRTYPFCSCRVSP